MVKHRFSEKFRSQLVTVKFYKSKSSLKNVKRLEGVRFCEATKLAMLSPVLLDRESISCAGAQYAFGWNTDQKNVLAEECLNKWKMNKCMLEPMLSQAPFFKKPFKYIGLNTDNEPDLMLSYMTPDQIMDLLKTYNTNLGKRLDVSLSTMMSICGGVAVKTHLEEKINFSFGCEDSRRFADIGIENLAVGIPKKMFEIFV